MSDHDPLVPAAPPLTVTENPLVPVEGRPDYVWPSWREALVVVRGLDLVEPMEA